MRELCIASSVIIKKVQRYIMCLIIYQFSQKTRLIQEGKLIGVQPEQKVTIHTQTKRANTGKL